MVDVTSMNVTLMSEIIELFGLKGCEKIPDHSILLWELNLMTKNCSELGTQGTQTSRKSYNVSNLPNEFMTNRDALLLIQQTIERIELSISDVNGANDAYSAFMDLCHSEMEDKLKSFSSRSKKPKGHKMKYKKYWNQELDIQWSKVCVKEKLWLKCKSNNKKRLKAEYCAERKIFDKLNRRYKRQQQRLEQEKLNSLLETDVTRDFWKEIGKLSLANDRKMKIPMEIVDSEGNSVFDTERVLEKWKSDYSNLLNSENTENLDTEQSDQMLQNDARNDEQLNLDSLNMDITYQEVHDAVYRAKLRKASGFDGIPSEILRYDICIELLYKIISYCFKNGEIPTEWTKGIIYPIPKSDSKDARDPLNYRGISLLSVPYKIYADILNQRLMKWLETNRL
ncbi:MAG: hypothetical protein AB2693_21220, partial [Candidatus Thiodiazotropha sp.]